MNTVRRVISAREAGLRLGRATATVEQGLRDGTFPVGTCYKTKSNRFVYIIPEEAFERFMNGEIAGRVRDGGRRCLEQQSGP